MNSIFIKTFAISLMATAFSASANAQGFTVKGDIKGVKDGTRVVLRFRDNGAPENLETLTKGGSFELKGIVKSPMMTTIEIDDRPKSEICDTVFSYAHGVNFVLENTSYTISAAWLRQHSAVHGGAGVHSAQISQRDRQGRQGARAV